MKKLLPILLLLIGYYASGQNTKQRTQSSNANMEVARFSNSFHKPIQWTETEPYINNFSRALKDNKFTFLNISGIPIAPPSFDGARNFSKHLAAVEINDKWGFINENGKSILPCEYEIVYDFIQDFTIVYGNKKWSIINKSGIHLKDLDIDVCYGFKNQIAIIEKNGKSGYLTAEGNVVFDSFIPSQNVQRSNTVINNNVAANCPDNLGFEFGNFTNWRCYTGSVDSIGSTNVITVTASAPVGNRHRIITRATPSAVDPFGLFPTNPPDGTNYAVKLGNTNIGAQAERIAYSIHVPNNDSNFSIKYDYAVVFQDPGHTSWSQPRFIARLFDSAANAYVDCASFEYISTSNLPGFARSAVDTTVIYKPWSSVFISLRAFAGKTMYLEFTTADCVRRGHWGYAYVDVENTCGQSIGVQYDCNFPNITTLDAPPGFQYYNWWNQNYTSIVTTGQHTVLNPGPTVNSTIWLEMIPFNTFGCRDTLAVHLTGGFTPSFHVSEINAACAPHTITFYNNNIPSTNATWNFGDGTTGIGDTVTHVYQNVGTYIVTMTVALPSGCSGSITDTIIISQPTASFNYSAGTFCNSQSVQFNVSTTGGSSYIWNFGDGTILTTTQATITHNYANAGIYIPSLIINYVGGCQFSLQGTDTIRIEDITPDFTYTSQQLCGSTALHFTQNVQSQFGISTYVWNFGDGSTGTGSITSHSYITAGTYIVKLVVTGITGCKDSVLHSVLIVLNTAPVISILAPTQACVNGPIVFNSTINSIDSIVSTIWSTSNGETANGNSSIFTFSQSGTFTITLIATTINGCIDTATHQIIINPLPVFNQPGDQAVCNGFNTNAVIFTGSAANTTYSWINDNNTVGLSATGTGNIASFTGTNTSSTTAYANIIVTATLNGCSATAPTFTFIINSTPESIQPANQTVCDRGRTDAVIFANFTNAIASNNYTWTNDLPSIGLPASGSGNIMAFTAINNTINTQTATITLTPTSNGCIGLPVNFSITVNPTPNLFNPANQELCNGSNSNDILFTNSTGADLYSWINNEPSIGLTTSGSGDIRTFTAINNSNTPITASISVYPTLHGCLGVSQYFNITVNPTPNVLQPGNQNVCNGASTSDVLFSGSVSGSNFTWANTLPTIGIPSNGVGDILSFNPINNGYTIDTATITVTPLINSCAGIPQTFTFIVLPLADLTQPFNQFICNGQQTPLITFNGLVSGTNYTWTNSNPEIGLSTNGNGDILPFIGVNLTNTTISSTVVISASANNCPGNTKTFTITVDPTPNMAQPSNINVCNGTLLDSISFVGNVSGTVFSWINNSSDIGLPASGIGNIASFVATNNTYAPITATISVAGIANSCNSINRLFSITVNPTPAIDSIPNHIICNGKSTNLIGITGSVSGTQYSWINNNPSIGLSVNGTGDIPTFNAVNIGTTPQIATINVYGASQDNCQAAMKTFKITINPSPQVIANNNINMCRGSNASLSANGATNYIWSPSTGLSNATIANPVTTATENTTYIVEGSNANGCKSFDTVLVSVIQPFDMIVSPNDTLCTGKTAQLNAMRADSYVWSPSTGLSNATISNPIATPTVNTVYRVIGYDANNCFTDTGYVYLTVGPSPFLNIGQDINEATGTTVTINPTTANGPITNWEWSPATNLSCNNCPSPTLTVANNTSYTLTVQNRYGCKATDTLNVVTFCKSAQVFVANAFTPDGDGLNDLLIVRGTGISVKSFRIFNRWGNLVFEKVGFGPNDPKYGWDGKVRGVPATPDVYVYIAEVNCDNGTAYMYKGNVTLLK